MTDDLLRKFAELNPVADPDRLVAFDAPDLPADPVLRALLEHTRTNGRLPDPVRSAHVRNTWPAHTRGTTQQRNGDMQTTKVRPDQQPTAEPRSRTLAGVGAAAAVILVAVAGLVVLNDRDPAPIPPTPVAPNVETMTDLEIIEAGVAALYSGDADRAVELFELGDIPDDRMRQYAAYQAAIGGRLTLDCTTQDTSGVFSCTTPYHNAMTDAIGYVDSPGDTGTVRVQDGVIKEFAFPFHTFIMISMEEFLASKGACEDEVQEECAILRWPLGPEETEDTISLIIEDLIMENLDEWAAWWAETNPTQPTDNR